jgi:hypothetical protein
MKIVYYLHVGSKENISDCLTKHLSHPQLWAPINEHLFYRWSEHGNVESFFLSLTDTSAPDGECQAGSGIGPEQLAPVTDASWHPVFYDGHWWLMPEGYGDWVAMPKGTLPWILINDVHVG